MNGSIPRLAQYGTVLAPATQVAQQRGSGNYNPPPLWEQSTNRGHAYSNAFNLYRNEYDRNNKDTFKYFPNPDNLYSTDYATVTGQNDQIKKQPYRVGTTGLHAETVNSWQNPEFEGVSDQYTEWALKALQMTPTPMIIYFFNTKNIEYLQSRIMEEVKRIKGVRVNPQSVDDLLIIMRSTYLYGMNGWLPAETNPNFPQNRGPKPCALEGRLSRLNESVLREAVKQVLSGIDQYKQYIKDKSSMPMPLDRPVYASMSGSRTLSENIGFNSGHERSLAAQSFNQRYNII